MKSSLELSQGVCSLLLHHHVKEEVHSVLEYALHLPPGLDAHLPYGRTMLAHDYPPHLQGACNEHAADRAVW